MKAHRYNDRDMVPNRLPRSRGKVLGYYLLIWVFVCVHAALVPGCIRHELIREGSPRVYVLRAEELGQARKQLRNGDSRLKPALEKLLHEADEALEAGPFSVMDKSRTPPSGDKHDYMSMGPYWWPDSTKPDGLPYIRRDGERNPESGQGYDRPRLGALVGAVERLALAYFFTDEEPYAEHATRLLRAWFLDPRTRMNPHLEFGQAIPGRVDGRGIGIIETRSFAGVVDAIGLIEQSRSWTGPDQQGMRAWMAAYLDWLLNSEHGKDEQDEHNNHGTWYDVQVASLALFTGDERLARDVLEGSKSARFDQHILPDGRQPHELARTRSLSYSVMNLEGLCQLAELGRHVGVDLWNYESPTGGSIRRALEYLAPYSDPEVPWPGEQITRTDPDLLLLHFRRAQFVYGDSTYGRMIDELPEEGLQTHRAHLTFPDVNHAEK